MKMYSFYPGRSASGRYEAQYFSGQFRTEPYASGLINNTVYRYFVYAYLLDI